MKPMNIILAVVLAVTVAVILSDGVTKDGAKVHGSPNKHAEKTVKDEVVNEVIYEENTSVVYSNDEAVIMKEDDSGKVNMACIEKSIVTVSNGRNSQNRTLICDAGRQYVIIDKSFYQAGQRVSVKNSLQKNLSLVRVEQFGDMVRLEINKSVKSPVIAKKIKAQGKAFYLTYDYDTVMDVEFSYKLDKKKRKLTYQNRDKELKTGKVVFNQKSQIVGIVDSMNQAIYTINDLRKKCKWQLLR